MAAWGVESVHIETGSRLKWVMRYVYRSERPIKLTYETDRAGAQSNPRYVWDKELVECPHSLMSAIDTSTQKHYTGGYQPHTCGNQEFPQAGNLEPYVEIDFYRRFSYATRL